MSRYDDETTVAQPQIFTLHWEGPAPAAQPVASFADEEHQTSSDPGCQELRELELSEHGRALWRQIRGEAEGRGDEELWRRKLHAYGWVKLRRAGSAGDYAREHEINHATVRSWIADVSRLAYEVGYRLHEDKLLLVGEAPAGLRRLRRLVNRDAGGEEARAELRRVESEFRGLDPYFHLNEGHVLRALGRLGESDETLKEGLTIAEARRVRSLLWNARGQTLWDCGPDSTHPVEDHLIYTERAFRRAAILDPTTYFPFVNLAQLAVDARDIRRAEYWIRELGTARKRMDDDMKAGLARYLDEAEWTRSVERRRCWQHGPFRWLREAVAKGVLPLLAAVFLIAASVPPASAAPATPLEVSVAHGGGSHSGAGGN
jgi:hypothetical protein